MRRRSGSNQSLHGISFGVLLFLTVELSGVASYCSFLIGDFQFRPGGQEERQETSVRREGLLGNVGLVSSAWFPQRPLGCGSCEQLRPTHAPRCRQAKLRQRRDAGLAPRSGVRWVCLALPAASLSTKFRSNSANSLPAPGVTGGTMTLWGSAAGAAVGSVALAAGGSKKTTDGIVAWMVRTRGPLLVLAVVLQKCASDGLTWYTRARLKATYSGANVALLSEVLKFPILAIAIALASGAKSVLPTFKAATTEAPLALAWVSAAYAGQNVLYFFCLEHISAAGYQVLSQSKLIFTAALMWVMLGKHFTGRQLFALALLMAGAAATQFAEVAGGTVLSGSAPWLGGALTVLSAVLSALPNVLYERLLKQGNNQWVANLQLTTWIIFWVAILRFLERGPAASGFGLSGLTSGFTPLVWCIVLLKTMNCIIIPACLKYADNIVYGYAKPVSIVLTCAVTSAVTSTTPPTLQIAGVIMVLWSMWLYGKA
eukprot:gb/GFBE01077949.1/.p1 GENE.gb/GFBE01077949.1/~~gb/GFBE01077949.1/.p1  ORF type:complete len:485 (+),score=53.70 gb/GFBE01077949.1/:1-1455(+)